jgi:hypothetical protein
LDARTDVACSDGTDRPFNRQRTRILLAKHFIDTTVEKSTGAHGNCPNYRLLSSSLDGRAHVVRRALLDAFEEHGLFAYTKSEPEIAVDELGRLRKTGVNKALEDFDENLRSRVISVLEQLHAIA